MTKVSVWLTSYNHEQFIRESIESILRQTYTNYELFIVDDCSTDGSWEIIQEYAHKDTRIKVIRHSQNQGESGLRTMLQELQGEYVAVAHCDDAWMPDKLEKQVKILDENHNIAACFTLADIIDDSGKTIHDEKNLYYQIFDQENRTRYEWLRYFFYHGNCLCHPSLLIRKSAYTEIGIISNGLHGLPDFCQWIRLCRQEDIYILQERLTKFRVHGDGSNTSGDNAGSIIRVYTEEWFILKEYEKLIDTHQVTAVFPEAEKYVVNGRICEKYALAQIMFQCPKNSYRLFGLGLLYELFQNQEQGQEINQLYGYTRKSYNADKQKYDIFHVIPESKYLQASIYLNGNEGYNEDNKISMNIYIQQTGAFRVNVDLRNYTEDMLQCVRVDLDEGTYRKFKICKCTCAGEDVEYRTINGIQNENWDCFYTLDPQYEFRINKKGILCIEGYTEEFTCSDVEQYYGELRTKYDFFKNHCTDLEQEIQRMKNTKIWKVRTKILRLLGK